jgi:hypothetical protein
MMASPTKEELLAQDARILAKLEALQEGNARILELVTELMALLGPV